MRWFTAFYGGEEWGGGLSPPVAYFAYLHSGQDKFLAVHGHIYMLLLPHTMTVMRVPTRCGTHLHLLIATQDHHPNTWVISS